MGSFERQTWENRGALQRQGLLTPNFRSFGTLCIGTLAGLMLADSHYRHQVVADIQPFRGLLLGLFFMSVGMSIDFGLFRDQGLLIAGLVAGLLLVKAVLLWGLCRVMGGYRELGLPVIKHTDGKLWSIIDMIIDSGISCLDPIDPQADVALLPFRLYVDVTGPLIEGIGEKMIDSAGDMMVGRA